MDPAVLYAGAIAALGTVAGFYRLELIRRAERAEAEVVFWRDKALGGMGLAVIATDVAEHK